MREFDGHPRIKVGEEVSSQCMRQLPYGNANALLFASKRERIGGVRERAGKRKKIAR